LHPVFAASRVQRISDLHSKFALRPHHELGLHMPIKFCPDPLMFAGVTREKQILSKYVDITLSGHSALRPL